MEKEADASLGRYQWTAVPESEVAEFYREKAVTSHTATVPLRNTSAARVPTRASEATPVRPRAEQMETSPRRTLPREEPDKHVLRTSCTGR